MRCWPKLPGKSALAGRHRYARNLWTPLRRYLDDGRLEIDNIAAEHIRPLALGRENYLFAGSDTSGERAGALYTLIQTAKLSGLDPEAYLRDVLTRIADYPSIESAACSPGTSASQNNIAPLRESDPHAKIAAASGGCLPFRFGIEHRSAHEPRSKTNETSASNWRSTGYGPEFAGALPLPRPRICVCRNSLRRLASH